MTSDMRRIFLIVLSVLLLHAGVAWAIDACLQHDGHTDHAVSAPRAEAYTSRGIDVPHEPAVPAIHCMTLEQGIGPAARAASVRVSPSDRVGSLAVRALHGALSDARGKDLRLDALFKRRAISSPGDLARHLFLSVLQV